MDTARLRGRQPTTDDLDFVMRVWNDAQVAPAIGGAQTEQQTRERIERWVRHWDDHGFGVTMFSDRPRLRPIGWGGLQYATIGIGDHLPLRSRT